MPETTVDEMMQHIKDMMNPVKQSFEQEVISKAPAYMIEEMMPTKIFKQLPVHVQYLLISMQRELDEFHEQIESIREHLDRTPL